MPQKCRITFGCSPRNSLSQERYSAGLNEVMLSSPSHLLHSGVQQTDKNRALYQKCVMGKRMEEWNNKGEAGGEFRTLGTSLMKGVHSSLQSGSLLRRDLPLGTLAIVPIAGDCWRCNSGGFEELKCKPVSRFDFLLLT